MSKLRQALRPRTEFETPPQVRVRQATPVLLPPVPVQSQAQTESQVSHSSQASATVRGRSRDE